MLCFNNFYFSILLSPYIVFSLKKEKKKLNENRRWKLNLQFGDALRSLGTALEAGYSVENSISEAYRDMSLSYEENDLIMLELRSIIAKLKNNIPIEEAFEELAKRSGIEDISSFVDIFVTSKRTGGDIISIIHSTTDVVRTRIDLKRELRTAIAAPKYESDIMQVVPFGILLYLRVFCPDMIVKLYGNMTGIIFMTAFLISYLILSEVARRIIRIDF